MRSINDSNQSLNDSSGPFPASTSCNNMIINHDKNYSLLLTNACSLSPKISSLHTYFLEMQLDFAMITESWLKDGQVLDRDVIDLEWGTDLKIIYKNRPKTPAGRRKVGGGVSIIYSKSRCNLRERSIRGNKFELVLAVGRVGKLDRQVAIFCIYLEPRIKAADMASVCELISGEILRLKMSGDPIIFIGADMNRKDIGDAIQDYPDVVQINRDPTRGDTCLDILFCNAPGLASTTHAPLETPTGVKSDHLCVVFSGNLPKAKDFTWIRKTTRKHSDEAVAEYGRRLGEADWETILPPYLGPDELVDRFQSWAAKHTKELFPWKTVRMRSNKPPWITDGIRKLARQKRRVFRREAKSNLWKQLQARQDRLIEASLASYVDNISRDGPCTRKYFASIKKLASPSTAEDWSLPDLFPGMTGKQAGEEVAKYFTRITDQFQPLQQVNNDAPRRPEISLDDVAKRLKEAKKSNSTVEGDLLPRVVKAHHSLLAPPAARIFNAVFRTGKWPDAWKVETTVVIPKIPAPGSLGDCRNISCTPFLSKVLEGVVLDNLRSSIEKTSPSMGASRVALLTIFWWTSLMQY